MKHLDEAKTLWAEIVPKSGQAKTQQGEMLRASEKLRDSWFREGNGYWDKDYEHFVAYLREHLTAKESFSADQKRQVNEDLATIADHESGEIAEEHFDHLTDLVVEWIHAHPEPITHEESLTSSAEPAASRSQRCHFVEEDASAGGSSRPLDGAKGQPGIRGPHGRGSVVCPDAPRALRSAQMVARSGARAPDRRTYPTGVDR